MACITEQQRAILDSFSIERLSDSEENLRLVCDFQNSRSDSLTNKIQSEAFEEDELGTVAFYVIKDKDRLSYETDINCCPEPHSPVHRGSGATDHRRISP